MRNLTIFALLVGLSLLGSGCDKKQTDKTEAPPEESQTNGAEDEPANEPEAAEDEGDEQSSFQLTSSAFEDGDAIPEKFTCDGDELTPPLSWEGAPEGTKSFVVVVEDPDAPSPEGAEGEDSVFYHWGLYSVSPDTTTLPEGVEVGGKAGVDAEQAKNDFGKLGYGGPCPPKGDEAHNYRFRVLALDTVGLSFTETPTVPELLEATTGNVLEETRLSATYKRKE